MMVHAAIENQEFLASGFFDVDDTRDIDACFTNEEPTGLDNKSSPVEIGVMTYFIHQIGNVCAEVLEIEFSVARKIRDAEPAAEIDGLERPSDLRNDAACQLD